MPQTDKFKLDVQSMTKAFNKAAVNYDEVALVQREVGQRLLQRFDYIKIEPKTILDVGMGTGEITKSLCQQFSNADVYGVDIALDMLKFSSNNVNQQPQSHVCADVARLPFATDSFDIVFSNLALHWCQDLFITMQEIHRVLKPDGLLMFSTLGPDTLTELRQSWAQVDSYSHVNSFLDMHDVGDVLLEVKLIDPVMDMEFITMRYQSCLDIMRDLKQLGAHNVTAGRSRGLTGKQSIKKVIQAYEAFRTDDNKYPVTYEVIYGHAWGRDLIKYFQENEFGEVAIPLSAIRRK